MATKTKDEPRIYEQGDINEHPVVASDIIYEGAYVGDNGAGYGRPLVAGDPFRGIAQRKADNSTGAAGAIRVKVLKRGYVVGSIASLAITDVGKDVYASDDDTLTLTQGSNTRVGYVARWTSTGVGLIRFEEANGAEAELTDSSGGTADGTVADVGAAFSQATLNNNFADLAAKINYLTRRLGN